MNNHKASEQNLDSELHTHAFSPQTTPALCPFRISEPKALSSINSNPITPTQGNRVPHRAAFFSDGLKTKTGHLETRESRREIHSEVKEKEAIEIHSFRDCLPVGGQAPTNFESGYDGAAFGENEEAEGLSKKIEVGKAQVRKRRQRLSKTNMGARKVPQMGFLQAYTLFKRKERYLQSLQHKGQTQETLKTSAEVEQLSQCIHIEMQRRRISSFWDSGSTSTAGEQVPDSPVASPGPSTFSPTSPTSPISQEAERVSNEVGQISAIGKGVQAQRTPPKNNGISDTLLHRLSQAPFKKSVVDVPDYAYNSDDDLS